MIRSTGKTQMRGVTFAIAALLSLGTAFAQPTAKPKPATTQKALPAKKGDKGEKKDPPPIVPLAEVLTGSAKDEYTGGKMLYETKDFANALVKFRKAYSLSPEPRLLKNIAVCEKDLRHYSRALALLEEYRTKAGEAITPQEDETLKPLEEALHTLTSVVTIVVSEPDATLSLDGEPIGTSPLPKPIRMDVGERKLKVEKQGYKAIEINKTIDGGNEVAIVAKLVRDWHRGKLVVEAGAKDLITFDGKVVGLGRYEAIVNSGGHTLRVSAPGMATYQGEVVIKDDETRRVPIGLNPLPAPPEIAKWAWIGGGIALLAGASIGGALLFQPTQIPPVNGSLGTVPLSFGGRP